MRRRRSPGERMRWGTSPLAHGQVRSRAQARRDERCIWRCKICEGGYFGVRLDHISTSVYLQYADRGWAAHGRAANLALTSPVLAASSASPPSSNQTCHGLRHTPSARWARQCSVLRVWMIKPLLIFLCLGFLCAYNLRLLGRNCSFPMPSCIFFQQEPAAVNFSQKM